MSKANILFGDGYQLRPVVYEIFYNNEKIKLTNKERALIQLLGIQLGEVVSFDQIIKAVWDGEEATENNVRTVVWRLRKKLPIDIIKSTSGQGYFIENNLLASSLSDTE